MSTNMTKEELFEAEQIAIEPYEDGFILADYSGNRGDASYCGVSMSWRRQPVVFDPFPSEQEAIEAAIRSQPTR